MSGSGGETVFDDGGEQGRVDIAARQDGSGGQAGGLDLAGQDSGQRDGTARLDHQLQHLEGIAHSLGHLGVRDGHHPGQSLIDRKGQLAGPVGHQGVADRGPFDRGVGQPLARRQ